MTLRRFVHEKTLELNLAAEILGLIRATHGFGRAYMIGMTQSRESRTGLDAALQAGDSVLGGIQFKAAHRPRTPGEYRFTLGEQQLVRLRHLERHLRGRVAYFLPMVATRDELRLNSPAFLARTVSLPVRLFSPGRHTVEIRGTRLTIRSDPQDVSMRPAIDELREWMDITRLSVRTEVGRRRDLDMSAIYAWASETAELDPRKAGQVFRGFALLAVPPDNEERIPN